MKLEKIKQFLDDLEYTYNQAAFLPSKRISFDEYDIEVINKVVEDEPYVRFNVYRNNKLIFSKDFYKYDLYTVTDVTLEKRLVVDIVIDIMKQEHQYSFKDPDLNKLIEESYNLSKLLQQEFGDKVDITLFDNYLFLTVSNNMYEFRLYDLNHLIKPENLSFYENGIIPFQEIAENEQNDDTSIPVTYEGLYYLAKLREICSKFVKSKSYIVSMPTYFVAESHEMLVYGYKYDEYVYIIKDFDTLLEKAFWFLK